MGASAPTTAGRFMVKLPETKSKTLVAVDAAIEAGQRSRHGYRLSASTIAEECERRIWLTFRWVTAPETFDGQRLRIFDSGKIYERRIMDWLKLAGLSIEEWDYTKPAEIIVVSDLAQAAPRLKQIGVSFADGHGYGWLDGEATNVPEAPVTCHVVEAKSHNFKSFSYLIRKGVRESKPEHFGQMQIYMHVRGRSRALYAAACKDNDALFFERIDYDFEYCAKLDARASRLALTDRAPPRQFNDPNSRAAWKCGFCRQAPVCHYTAMPEVNCRTCLYVTAQSGGDWFCEKLQIKLTREDQERGCGLHMYLPDVVPGEQVDAADDVSWIEYRLRDGRIFRDQVRDQHAT